MKKVAIAGVEGSGKTVFLAAMGRKYEIPDENGVFLTPQNRRTYSYYTSAKAMLEGGDWPLATQPGEIVELDWKLRIKGGSGGLWEELAQLSFLDFAGEVYREAFGGRKESGKTANGEKKPQEAVDRLKSHVVDADVLIVLVDLGKIVNGSEKDDRTIEMNWLSQAILSFAFEEAHKSSVALVFTQSDRYEEIVRQCGGVRGALAKHLRIVDSNYGDQLSLFAVSSVDSIVPLPDNPTVFLPAKDFKSRGLEDLMSWLVGCLRADRAVFRPQMRLDSPQAPESPLVDNAFEGRAATEGAQGKRARDYRRKSLLWLIGLCLVLGGLCAYALAILLPRLYASAARFLDGLRSDEVAVQDAAESASEDETAMRAAEAKRKAAAEAEAKRRAEEMRRKAEETEANRRAKEAGRKVAEEAESKRKAAEADNLGKLVKAIELRRDSGAYGKKEVLELVFNAASADVLEAEVARKCFTVLLKHGANPCEVLRLPSDLFEFRHLTFGVETARMSRINDESHYHPIGME